jgi:hypothetical protein
MHVCGGPFRRFHLAAAGDYFFGRVMADAAGRKPSRFGLLLRTALRLEPMHGWGITERIEQWSESVLQLGQAHLGHFGP